MSYPERHPWSPPAPRPSVSRLLRADAHPLDLLALAVVPVALVWIFLLPEATRTSLVFVYDDPDPLRALAAPYVHLHEGHLGLNLLVYGAVVPLAYLLDVLSGNRQRFFIVFVTLLLALAPVVSYLNLAVVRPGATVGFSVVNLGFVGYLALSMGDFTRAFFLPRARLNVAAMAYLVGLAWVAVLTDQTAAMYALAGGTLALVGVYLVVVISRHRATLAGLDRATRWTGGFDLLVVSAVVFLVVPVFAFGAGPEVNDVTINLYGHFTGFALGFLAPFLAVYLFAFVAARS